jgi:hypothetical protein
MPDETTRKNKVSFDLCFSGKVVARIDLSPLEYEAVRTMRPEDAVQRIMSKVPELRGEEWIVAEFVRQIALGSYRIREKREGRTGK